MSPVKFLFSCLIQLGLWVGAIPSSSVWAHPFHTTTGEMEYNAKTGRFEVAVKVLAVDLEEALTRQAAAAPSPASRAGSPATRRAGELKRVALKRSPEVEGLIVAYLRSRFFLTSRPRGPAGVFHAEMDGEVPASHAPAPEPDRSGSQSKLHWVGMELERESVWLYFELELHPVDRLSLSNSLFIELNAQQINTCTLRTPATKYALRTDARQPEVALPPHAPMR